MFGQYFVEIRDLPLKIIVLLPKLRVADLKFLKEFLKLNLIILDILILFLKLLHGDAHLIDLVLVLGLHFLGLALEYLVGVVDLLDLHEGFLVFDFRVIAGYD